MAGDTLKNKAWAAGLFEGEGCISDHTNGRTDKLYPRLTLGMRDKDIVERFNHIVKRGRIYLCRDRTNPHYVWVATRKEDCEAVLKLFLPFLGKRRKARARQALETLRLIESYN